MRKTVLILLMFLVMAGVGRAATYYVSQDGDGTDANSWVGAKTTIDEAIRIDLAGSTIDVNAGTYSENSTATADALNIPTGTWIIQSHSGVASDVNITGTSTSQAIRVYGGSGTATLRNITVSSTTATGANSGTINIGNAQSLVLDGCIVKNAAAAGAGIKVRQAFSRALTITDSTISSDGSQGIDIVTGATNIVSALTITGSTVTSVTQDAIVNGGTITAITIDDSTITAMAVKYCIANDSVESTMGTFYISDTAFVSGGHGFVGIIGVVVGGVLDNCTFNCLTYWGVRIDDAVTCGKIDVENCTFTDCICDIAAFSTAPIVRNSTFNMTTNGLKPIRIGLNEAPNANPVGMALISGNTVAFTGAATGHGILNGVGSPYALICNNKISGCDFGIVTKSDAAMIRNNEIYQNATYGIDGIFIQGSNGSVAEYNTVYAEKGIGIVVEELGISQGAYVTSSKTKLRNNIIVTTSTSPCIWLCAETAAQTTTYADWNLLYSTIDGNVLAIESVIVPSATIGTATWTDANNAVYSVAAFTAYTWASGDTFQTIAGTGVTDSYRVVVTGKTNADAIALNSNIKVGDVADIEGNVMRNAYYTAAQIQASLTGTPVYSGVYAALCDQHSLFLDPLLYSPSTGNFKLKSTSPCLNTGEPTPDDGFTSIGAWQRKSMLGVN
jgi:hypothetical protein